MKFEETGLKAEIVKGVKELGFEYTMPIQEKVIEAMLEHRSDLIGIAQTGTGKTAAYGLPLIHLIDPKATKVQALILTPTRELCIQVADDLVKFSKYSKAIEVLAVYGGASIENQIRGLHKNVQLVVGTPGRLRDLIRRKKLDIKSIKTIVLDEADEMLSMGFKEELDAILTETPTDRQTLLFSATMPREIAEIAENYMNDPIEIAVGRRNVGADNVEHFYYMVNASDRYLALKRIADINPDLYGIVFCRTRKETKDVAEKLIADGYNADALHGDLSQAQRDQVMNRFRMKNLQMLVATDVAARGLDVNDLTHIINYNLPDESEVYIHRSGRTGRAGKTGICLTIIHSREKGKISNIKRMIRKEFEQKLIPSGAEICEKQLFKLIDKMEKVSVDESKIGPFLPIISKKLEWLSREDLIKHFVSLEFNRFLNYYKDAPDLNVQLRESKGRNKVQLRESKGRNQMRSKSPRQKEFSRFFINAGSQEGLEPSNLIGLINEKTKKRDIEIGRIEIMKKFSFFEVDYDYTDRIIKGFENAEYAGVKVVVELAQDKKDFGTSKRSLTKKSSKDKGKKPKKSKGKPKKTR
ncbi:DEAD/DEAH box helicase [bacterium]|nr:DEAD/DEAH box helicase [bacterium]